jgi:hypothetical protein
LKLETLSKTFRFVFWGLLGSFGVFWEITFFRGAGEVLQGSLVRLVSLWWEFPPRLDSKNNILSGRLQQFFVFQNEEFYSALIEIRYDLDITGLFDFILH